MGQKVSPIGLRVGINKDWESKWYAPKKDFSKNLIEDIKIREYVEKNLKGKGIAKVEIEKNYAFLEKWMQDRNDYLESNYGFHL